MVKRWSDAHPHHMPITILTELNDTSYNLPTPILPWDGPAMDQLDAEIRSVFPPRDVITPDLVRGRHATLAEAVTTDGWPTIDSVRGKVMFVMDNAGSYRDTYTAGHPTLEHREIFTNSAVGRPDAAFIKLNDPIGDNATIRSVVAAGYVTRTRADADTHEARGEQHRASGRCDRQRRAMGEHGLRGSGPCVRSAVLRVDSRWHAGALQPDQRAVVVHVEPDRVADPVASGRGARARVW